MNLGKMDFKIDPDKMERKLLVVVDMQNDFVTGVLGTREAKAMVEPLVKFVKSFDGDVVYTQDTHYDDYLETQEGQRLPVPHCIKDTKGWEIIPELDPHWILHKQGFGALKLAVIASDDVPYEEIHFVGVCTGICVIANAVIAKSFAPESRIVIHKDLCACITPESHRNALAAMKTLQMDIV